MVPYNADRLLEHQVTSVLTSDASSDGHSPANRSFSGSQDQDGHDVADQQLFFVTSYSDFDKLAHGPRGHTAKHTLRVYRFHTDGSLLLLHICGEGSKVINPAFSRFHPRYGRSRIESSRCNTCSHA